MAEEKLTTKLELSGEQEYKNGLKLVSAELKAHRSELSLVKSQYEGNMNSAEALRAKLAVLEKQHETQSKKVEILSKAMKDAQERQAHYATAAEQARKALDALEASGSATTEELEKQQRALSEASAYAQQAEKSVLGYQTQLNNAQAALNTLNTEIDRNKGYLSEAEQSADGCATSIDGYGKEVKEAEEASSAFAGQALSGAGIVAAAKKIFDYMSKCATAAMDFQSAMTGVAKTTDLTDAELAGMSAEIKKLSTEIPIAQRELAAIVEVAGQLGVAKGDLMDFAETMAMLSTATTMSADEGATMLAQFANITQMASEYYDELAAATVDLGNNYATTEQKILDMAQGMAASASLAGMTEAQILGISAAVSSLGIEAQAGSSSMSRIISEIMTAVETGSDSLENFARVAGMSAEEFTSAWQKDAASALEAFVTGLSDVDRNGQSAIATLTDLEITEIRMQRALLSLSNSGDLLSRAIGTANEAWAENTALVNEAQKRYATTESRLQMMQNAYGNLKIAIGDNYNPALGKMYELMTDVLNGSAEFVERNPALVKAITAAATVIGTVTAAIVAYNAVAKVAKALDLASSFSALAGPAGVAVLAAAGIAAVVAALSEYNTAASELSAELDGIRAAAESADDALVSSATGTLFAAESAETYIQRLEQLEASLGENGRLNDLAAEKQTEYNAAVEVLRALLPDVNIELDEQTGRIEGGTAALRDQIAAWKELAITEILQTTLTEKFQAATNAAKAAAEAQRELADEYNLTLENALERADELRNEAFHGYNADRNFALIAAGLNDEAKAIEQLVEAYHSATDEAQRFAGEAEAFAGNMDAMVDALLSGSSEGVAALVSSFAGVKPILDESSAAAETAGAETIENYTDGIEDGADDAKRTAASVGESAGDALAAGFEDGASRTLNLADKLTEALTPTAEAVRTLTDEMTDLSAAFAEQDENGRLSYDTIVGLIDAGYAAALSVDSETGAVRLNAEAYTALASARIAAQIAAETESAQAARTKAMEAEKFAAIELSNRNIDLAESYMEAYAAQVAIVQGHEAAIAALKDLQANLSSVTAGTWSSGVSGSRGSSGSSRSSAKTDTAEDKYAAEKRLLDFERDMDRIADSDYYDKLEQLVAEYLTENSEKWMSETAAIYKGRRSLADAAAKDAEDALKAQQKAEKEALEAAEKAREEEAEAAAEARREQYETELADLDYFRDLGLVSEAEYYEGLRRIRDEYCERESEEWRKHTTELYDYLVEKANETVAELKDAAAKAFDEDEATLAEHVAAKKALIKEERDALVAAKEAEIEAINAEIAARKRAREDAEAEDELAAKRRAVEAARDELAYARTDEDRLQLEREVARLELQLADAVADREFELWEREQNDKIAALEEEAAKIEAAAAEQIARLESEEANAAARIETQRRQHAQYLAALSASAAQQVEAAYAAAPTSTIYNTTTNNSSPSATININPQTLTGAYLEERIKRVLEELSR